MSVAKKVSWLAILLLGAVYIQPSDESGLFPPIQLSPNDSSVLVYGSNIIGNRIYFTTNRNGSLHLEIFDVTGVGSEASVSLAEISDIGLNMTDDFAALTIATDTMVVVTYAIASRTIILERNSTGDPWQPTAVFNNMRVQRINILSESKIFFSTQNSIGFFVKNNGEWVVEELDAYGVGTASIHNGTIAASDADDKTLRIYEAVDGNFTQVQQLTVQDEVAIDKWGQALLFASHSEIYLGNSVPADPKVSMYIHRFARLDNGTWVEEPTIDTQYYMDSWAVLYNNLIVGVGVYGTDVTTLMVLIDRNTFNGTNVIIEKSFAYSSTVPYSGAIATSGGTFFTAIQIDKSIQFFEINPSCRDGVKEQNEQCDSGTNCDSFCFCTGNLTRSTESSILDCVPSCGNGYLDTNEECDAYFIDTCRSDCTCQNGYEPTGNTSCRLICGNGVINQGESCDPGMDENCDKSCVACKTGYTLSNYSCIANEIQAPVASSSGLPEYVTAIAIVIPIIVAAGITALIVMLVKKRNQRKKSRAKDSFKDSKYISLSTTKHSPSVSNGSKQNISGSLEQKLDIPYRDITLKHEIGAGAFGKVFLGEWQKVQVALKLSSVGDTKEFRQEAKLMIDLRSHPNVVQVLGLCTDAPFPILILEYCDGGSLESVVKRAPLSEDQLIDYAFGIARGMLHLHLNNIIHRDLAARNVLIDDGVPKISDFGMARFVEEYKEGKTGNTVGPLNWMAPESLLHQTYSVKSDMWSFGCLLFELVTGKELYENLQPVDVYHGVTRGHLHPDTPDTAPRVIKMIMTKCFEFDPDKRPTFEEVCNWLREPSQFEAEKQLAQRSSQSSSHSQSNESS